MEFERGIAQTLKEKIFSYMNERPDLFYGNRESDEDSNLVNLLPLAAGAKYLPTHGDNVAMREAKKQLLQRFGKSWTPIDLLEQINENRRRNPNNKLNAEACVEAYDTEALVCRALYFGDGYKACINQAEDNYNNCRNTGSHGGRGVMTFEEISGQANNKRNPEKKRGQAKRDAFELMPIEAMAHMLLLGPYMSLKSASNRPSDQSGQPGSVDRFLRQITVLPDDSLYGTPSSASPYGPPPWLLPMLLGGGLRRPWLPVK